MACTFARSSVVKSTPAVAALSPFRLIWITPTTFPSFNTGALMIFWIDSPLVVAAFTPSNTVACRTDEKLLLISARLSRAVRAASAELLVNGTNPTFFRAAGTRKCRCLHRLDTAKIATSSTFTRSSFAIFSASAGIDTSAALDSSASSALASRSSSDTKLVDIIFTVISAPAGREATGHRG